LNHHILQASSQKTHKPICGDPSAEVLLIRPAEELKVLKVRFAKWGECTHPERHFEKCEIYGCGRSQVLCGVCNKIIKEWYN